MLTPRNAAFVFVAACSLAVAACQPADTPAERVGRDIDHAAKRLADQVDKGADKTKEAAKDAKK